MLFKEAQAFIENMYKECHYETQIINKRSRGRGIKC